ncbi:MBL fold metallo-hydrolase [Nocardioides insulae]|uniref:MBL fold metallo-hydrolase n=1 Tax=Nocardioides insulae TaxID=394734 RepID=UPI00048CE0C7|nr:MBL fold metallo-hydrolase [Nocardioides insulae]
MSARTTADGRLHELVPGVHAWVQPDGSWWVNNAGLVRGRDAALVVDTCATARRTELFLAAAADAAGGTPIRWALNTHQHGDHTYGNSLLPASTTIIGHTLMRAGLSEDPVIDGCPPFWDPVPDWGPVVRRLPDLAVEGAVVVHLGELDVHLLHPGGPAHTPGDLVAWLPDRRVLFTGDLLFSGLTPLVFMGSVTGAMRALDWIAAFDPAVVVPGHGPVVEATGLGGVLAEHRRYYGFVAATAERGLAAGLSPLEAARTADLGEFAGWADSERLVLNLHRAYADHHGTDLDVIAAFTDATAWLGGPMHTHV